MKKHFLGICFLIFLVLYSCTSTEEKLGTLQESDLNSELSQIKEQLFLGINQRENWKRHWEEVRGSTPLDPFEWVRTDSIEVLPMPEKNPILSGDPLEKFQFEHPEGKGIMDIYSSKVETRGDISNSFFNPDGEVVFYKADGMKERLLFMGPSGLFEEGFWLSSSLFLVLGYFQEVEGYRPMAWIIDVEKHLLYQFQQESSVDSYEPFSYLKMKLTEER